MLRRKNRRGKGWASSIFNVVKNVAKAGYKSPAVRKVVRKGLQYGAQRVIEKGVDKVLNRPQQEEESGEGIKGGRFRKRNRFHKRIIHQNQRNLLRKLFDQKRPELKNAVRLKYLRKENPVKSIIDWQGTGLTGENTESYCLPEPSGRKICRINPNYKPIGSGFTSRGLKGRCVDCGKGVKQIPPVYLTEEERRLIPPKEGQHFEV